jgi:hypothetical protein
MFMGSPMKGCKATKANNPSRDAITMLDLRSVLLLDKRDPSKYPPTAEGTLHARMTASRGIEDGRILANRISSTNHPMPAE